ncbi:type II toxin-antitoxin system HipA family toxin [Puniceicoccaceae bacterium K14]|nr:type II toxin-antitoxin system HipA family toxin [Puniceicoccaceae bacterium K14]
MSIAAEIHLWGTQVGVVSWDDRSQIGSFQYDHDFLRSGIQISPIHMPLRQRPYSFPNLKRDSFSGLPGTLADSLPDKFGHLLIDQWLAKQGRLPDSFTPIERLCYVGSRAMGALEFLPETRIAKSKSQEIQIDALVGLANEALSQKEQLQTELDTVDAREAMNDIIRVGTSAGGARAKAVIAWNPETNQVHSGQLDAPEGFTHWLLKLDGVSGNRDKEVADPMGYGKIEYAYHLMAVNAGIFMMDCRLFEEGGRSHFMTRRFDRGPENQKIHMQTLCGMAHYDFNQAGAYSYEQAILVMRQLGLPHNDIEEQYRRAIFNILARNQDDHTKNIAFLMNKKGQWRLSPAYDINYSYNPQGAWTSSHQMSLNGKRDNFLYEDFLEMAKNIDIKTRKAKTILTEVLSSVYKWKEFADKANVEPSTSKSISNTFRMLHP